MSTATTLFLAILAASALAAQQAHVNLDHNPHKNTGNLLPFGASLISPEVRDDRTVSFQVKAPEAASVMLTGAPILLAIGTGNKPVPFHKGDDGVWRLTVGPLKPNIYVYKLIIDGVTVPDPNNTLAGVADQPPYSQLIVHGDKPAYYDARNVPHGAVTRHVYRSEVTNGEREIYVYTPPGYDRGRKYPVLYLTGGSGELASNWALEGRANFIMDNLLAEGKALPMVIAMPNNQMVHRGHPQHQDLTFKAFEAELRKHIVPFVEQHYSVRAGRRGRALAGLSMGGRHTQIVGFRCLDLFASFGILSAGDPNTGQISAEFLNDPEVNQKLDYLFVGQGTGEERPASRTFALRDALVKHKVRHEYYAGGDGGHDWGTWRHLLHARLLPGLWRIAESNPQQPTPLPNEPLKSPEVLSDNRVTFRIYAPRASEVSVGGDWISQGRGSGGKLQKDDKGVWSISVGPLIPDIYSYSFNVDGVRTIDPKNAMIKQGLTSLDNVLVVPGTESAFQDNRPVPHGEVRVAWYHSTTLDAMRSMHIYTPPGYETGKAKYPVFYLLHGGGDDDSGWSTIGRAGFILDNLLAAGKAKPMIVVMPNGSMPRTGQPGTPGFEESRQRAQTLFAGELLTNVMAYVEKHYRVLANRESRAIAGLSMGGGQTLAVGPANLDKFAYMGVWSAGVNPDRTAEFEKRLAGLLDNPEKTNKTMRLFWIGVGSKDTLAAAGARNLAAILKQRGIKHEFHETEGGHTWINWRRYLNDYSQLLFR